jgi:hypothetical protein
MSQRFDLDEPKMKEPIRTWRLKTFDNIDVCGDGRGNYSLEALANYAGVKLTEGERPEDDMEALREEISDILGVECHWVRGPDLYE